MTGPSDLRAPYGYHLPIFPTIYRDDEREAWVERAASRLTDTADRVFLEARCTKEQYDAWTLALDRWAERESRPVGGQS